MSACQRLKGDNHEAKGKTTTMDRRPSRARFSGGGPRVPKDEFRYTDGKYMAKQYEF